MLDQIHGVVNDVYDDSVSISTASILTRPIISRLPPQEFETIACGFSYAVNVIDLKSFNIGSAVYLYLYHQKGEYTDALYGFQQKEQRVLFRQLLSVDKIGPKAAMAIMRLGAVEDIKQAIRMRQTTFLARARGVAKGADRIVLKLGPVFMAEKYDQEHASLI